MNRAAAPPSIAVVVLAYNRVHLLKQCVEKVLLRTSDATREILIWDNNSSDGTAAYLDALDDPRITVISHPTNVGLNAYADAFPRTSADYLVVLDEDVIEAPQDWDRVLLDAFVRLPDVGFLATNQVDDENSLCASIMHHKDRHLYEEVECNGVRLLDGPAGGWCGMTSRAIHDQVGGFPRHRKQVFFHFDSEYITAIETVGLRATVLRDLEVFHASGPYYSKFLPEKHEFYASLERQRGRKDAVKRVILSVPFARSLNQRYAWFSPPEPGSADSQV